jgi:hypothetical protein
MSSVTRASFFSPLLLAAAITVGDGVATPADAQCNTMFVNGNRVTVCLNGRNGRNGVLRPPPGGIRLPGTGGYRYGPHNRLHTHRVDMCRTINGNGLLRCRSEVRRHVGFHYGPYHRTEMLGY